MIVLEKASKSYDSREVVRSIDLEVPKGSIFGLIGPNGAGKTTMLKMISTLIKPDSGRIAVAGLDASRDVRAVRRILGYMPDQFGAFRNGTCGDYLEFFARAYGYHGPALTERVNAVLSLTDLDGLRLEGTAALSTGMRQRLSLAKTLLNDPEVLILDEPASGLDPRARIEIRSLLKELGTMGKTIMISSHILTDLEEICSDVAILELGSVVWSGSLAEGRKALRAQRFEVLVEVPVEDIERALKLIQALDGVVEAAAAQGKIEAKLSGRHGNRLLEALIAAGIEVLSFSEKRTNLEAIFLEQTKGILS
jgi:ABC-2 type transport system ATP-binding protein